MNNYIKYFFLGLLAFLILNCSQKNETNKKKEYKKTNKNNDIVFLKDTIIDLTDFSNKEKENLEIIKSLVKNNLLPCCKLDKSDDIYFDANSKDTSDDIYIDKIIYLKMDKNKKFVCVFSVLGSMNNRFCFVEYKDNLKYIYVEGIPKTLSIGRLNNRNFYNLLSTEKTNENITIFISNCIFSNYKTNFEHITSYI